MKQFIDKLISNIEWIITSLFLIILPIIYSKYVLDPVLYPRYLALSIWVTIISIVLIIKLYRGKFELQFSTSDKFIFGAAALFVLANAISSFGAINSAEAIYKTFKEFTLMVIFFYFVQLISNNEKGRDIAIKSTIIMAGIFLAIGFYQLADADFSKVKTATEGYGYWFRQAIKNVKSTLASINPFATMLYLSLAFSTYGIFAYKKLWRIFSILVWVSALFFIVMLASKAAWGALGLAVITGIILGYIFIFQLLPKQRGKELPIFVKVGALLIPFILFFTSLYLVEKTEIKVVKVAVEKAGQIFYPEKYISATYNADNPTSAQMREFAWANTIEMTKDHPMLGVGPGQWRIVYAKYGLDKFDVGVRNGSRTWQRPHNDFLWILGEVGIIGLSLFVFIFICVFVVAYKNIISNTSLNAQLFNGIAFSFLMGYLIILFVDFSRERIAHNVVYLLLFALILSFNNQTNKKTIYKPTKTLSLALIALIIVLSIFNLRLAIDMVNGDKAARNIQIAIKRNNMPLMAKAIRSIEGSYYTLDPFNTPIAYYKGTLLHKQGKIEEAKQEFIEAYELNPYFIRVLTDLGTSYEMTGDKENALIYYQKALDISPRYKEALVNMAIVQYNLNKITEALGYIVKVPYGEANPPKYEKALITISRKRAIQLANDADPKKLQDWLNDENKIKSTFVRYQQEKNNFDKILLQEIGK